MKTFLLIAAFIGSAGIIGISARYVYILNMNSLLLETWPSVAAKDPSLAHFAADQAKPALAGHCAQCHGTDLRGDPGKGVPNLVDKEWLYGNGDVSDIEQTIVHGIRSGARASRDLADMPGFAKANPYWRYKMPSLGPQELSDVVDFILKLNGKPVWDPEGAARGEILFQSKAQCYDCHTPDAKGDDFIGAPNLTPHAWLYGDGSRQSLMDVIAYGRRGICPAWSDRLRPSTIRAIAIYLHNRSGSS
jgi:cytochrome c oxidase cbb3-type subunit 3